MRPSLFIATILLLATAACGSTAREACQTRKMRLSGAYAACRLAAENHRAGGASDDGYLRSIERCDRRFVNGWARAQALAEAAGDACPTKGDDSEMLQFVTFCSNAITASTTALSELPLDVISATPRAFPASGQTTAFGSRSDGDLEAGARLSFVDNGDGTVTDNNTGLMWEKKDDSGGVHDQDNQYTWGMTSSPYTMNGTLLAFIDALNSPPCFAAHCDWRLPNPKELQSLIDYEAYGPSVTTEFHDPSGCPRCTDVTAPTCSCTLSTYYWTSTTVQNYPQNAWIVTFYNGWVGHDGKDVAFPARAVRG